MASYLTSKLHLRRLAPRRRAADSAGARFQTPTAGMRCGTFVGLDGRSLNGGVRQAVAKPWQNLSQLKRLELPLSEKQNPQVVENLESGDKSREALETGTLRVKQPFDPKSRNAVGEGRSRPRGMRLIRTSTVCPRSKRSMSKPTKSRNCKHVIIKELVRPSGFEPPTFCSGGKRSMRMLFIL